MKNDTKKTQESVQQQIDHIAEVCRRVKPLVLIRCITFNHEKYLREALESFVAQNADFPFVVIVHDDASTDQTPEILREYAEKYPDIILPVFEEENQYSKHDGSLRRVLTAAQNVTGAKYFALCEGDDYWVDSQKLQRQVSFLENNPDYTMTFANAINHWEDGSHPDELFSNIEDRDYKAVEFVENWIVPTASVVFRAECYNDKRLTKLVNSGKMMASDTILFLTCAYRGKVRGMSDVFSVYRRLQSGAVQSTLDKQPHKFLIHEITIAKAFGGDVLKYFKTSIAEKAAQCITDFLETGKLDTKFFLRAFRFTPKITLSISNKKRRIKRHQNKK